jgi:hypothetical protein
MGTACQCHTCWAPAKHDLRCMQFDDDDVCPHGDRPWECYVCCESDPELPIDLWPEDIAFA